VFLTTLGSVMGEFTGLTWDRSEEMMMVNANVGVYGRDFP